ncbi:hypothetical protein BRADO4487 [Bradyrhizobium sp. ORS 278]|uniref:CC0125/CC1285 family lipoprotein n=1 Tax=Bradyrhizobium sp. (strain ORS 278) TaxID=114615 RepID=UPI0001508791|nr:hypothetical protein [Bradyrhizobium sp. ORS 278]CAL78225.1 hypothetical protein BRADO4487 [Bradyrhizobium sp. ORS 278]
MRRRLMNLAVTAVALTLVSCATPYQDNNIFGGADVTELRPDVARVSFRGNGFTTKESVQVYWLNRCAELAVAKGYAGFEILSDMQFVMRRPTEEDTRTRLASAIPSLRVHIPVSANEASDVAAWRDQRDTAGLPASPVKLAGVIFIPMNTGGGPPKPAIEGDIHFLPAPVASAPPKVFNAKDLIAQLEPLIKGEKCAGNICPHVHEYLLPKGKLR